MLSQDPLLSTMSKYGVSGFCRAAGHRPTSESVCHADLQECLGADGPETNLGLCEGPRILEECQGCPTDNRIRGAVTSHRNHFRKELVWQKYAEPFRLGVSIRIEHGRLNYERLHLDVQLPSGPMVLTYPFRCLLNICQGNRGPPSYLEQPPPPDQ